MNIQLAVDGKWRTSEHEKLIIGRNLIHGGKKNQHWTVFVQGGEHFNSDVTIFSQYCPIILIVCMKSDMYNIC